MNSSFNIESEHSIVVMQGLHLPRRATLKFPKTYYRLGFFYFLVSFPVSIAL